MPEIRARRARPGRAGWDHLGAGGQRLGPQIAIGGDDDHLVLGQPLGKPAEDLAVGSLGATVRRPGDLDPLADDLRARLVLEHHRNPLVAVLGPAVDLADESRDRPLVVAPPSVGPGPDHVHRIDDVVHPTIIAPIASPRPALLVRRPLPDAAAEAGDAERDDFFEAAAAMRGIGDGGAVASDFAARRAPSMSTTTIGAGSCGAPARCSSERNRAASAGAA